ncbi:MAG TPA: DUF3294 domain-containing protein [Oscillatoriaceae cyanobacterium]
MTTTTQPMTGEFFEAWRSSMKAMTWSQDQLEKLASTWMEQGRTMRHDGEKVLEVLISQAKTNCEEMQQKAEHGFKSSLQAVPGWDLLTQNDLRRQMDELNKKLDGLGAR